VLTVSLGALILVLAERLAGRDFATIAQYIQIAAGALVVAIIALCIKSMTKDNASVVFDPLRHLVSYTPIALPILLYLSMTPQPDRALGRPNLNAVYAAAAILAIAVIVALKNFDDAVSDEIWALLAGLGLPIGYGLALLGFTLGGPMPNGVKFSEAQVRDWIFFGGIAMWVLGVLLAIHLMDYAYSAGFWYFIQTLGIFGGIGAIVIMASRTQHQMYSTFRPYMRVIAAASIVLAFVGGLFIALDASSDSFWIFWTDAVETISLGAIALGVYEVTQTLGSAQRAPMTPPPEGAPATGS
jgi:hypothetical protein